jgi:uncharacterized protein (DUF2252 family)
VSRRDRRGQGAASRGGRSEHLVHTLTDTFSNLMEANPTAFRAKFRTMARDPFAFYRGTAGLFYADVAAGGPFAGVDDRWTGEEGARRVWIQGDLHAENFGTYLDRDGRLVFDVNDFDEAYLGHWTWDPMRFCASLALLCWQKALPDEAIDELVGAYLRAYVEHVHHYVETDDDTEWALTLDTARGGVLRSLQRARMSTRVSLLDGATVVDDFRRRFAQLPGVRRLEDDETALVRDAFDRYVQTLPGSSHDGTVTFDVLDVVGRSGFGIGSAGLPAYNVLIEGFSQALDNDVVLTVKQGNVAAPSRVVDDPDVARHFEHHGHRTALSQRALQAHADRFLGWTELPGTHGPQTGYVVSEYSPYEADLDWDGSAEPAEMLELVEQLGRATAKIHCVADDESEHDLVAVSVEEVVSACVGDDVDDFVQETTRFAHAYAEQVRTDHALFVDAFRSGGFGAVTSVASPGE